MVNVDQLRLASSEARAQLEAVSAAREQMQAALYPGCLRELQEQMRVSLSLQARDSFAQVMEASRADAVRYAAMMQEALRPSRSFAQAMETSRAEAIQSAALMQEALRPSKEMIALSQLFAEQRGEGARALGEIQIARSGIEAFGKALAQRQTDWAAAISSILGTLDRSPIQQLLAATRELTRDSEIQSLLASVHYSLNERAEISIERLIEDVTDEIGSSSAGPGLADAISAVVSRIPVLDESSRSRLAHAVLLVIGHLLLELFGSLSEVEYQKMRNAADDAAKVVHERQQQATLTEIQHSVEELSERVTHPPRPAVTVRAARLRVQPDTASATLLRLEPGTPLIVLERSTGWVQVEVEQVPGAVHEGWVYGPLVRYLP